MQVTLDYLADKEPKDVLHLAMMKINKKGSIFNALWVLILQEMFGVEEEIENLIPVAIYADTSCALEYYKVCQVVNMAGNLFVLDEKVAYLNAKRYGDLIHHKEVRYAGDEPTIEIGLLDYID